MTSPLRARIKHFLKRLLLVGLSCVLGVTALAYTTDYLVFRYRVSANRQPFGQVTVTRYDAVAQKNGKTQFIFNPPETQTCVHALFPERDTCPAGIYKNIQSSAPTSEEPRDASLNMRKRTLSRLRLHLTNKEARPPEEHP